ncbi:MAG TPA: GNAT family N-acetyltransferase, partial [Candidatus Limnocylindrales bacterium]|nr:GNAT family N-acetyltransferase [Candidatus Limnocylindrales bacterium]
FPGCFGWGPGREAVLARAGSAVGRYVDWCLEHGEAIELPADGRPEIVEEVRATVLDGHERNARFAADDQPVSDELLATVLRRAGHARADTLLLVERLQGVEATNGYRDAKAGSRPSEEVLRHLCGTEIWLTSRLDRTARYDGPGPDAGLAEHLAATRAWTFEHLRLLQARDPAAAGVDGKGEAWTLFKVLRRVLYHALDHLEELDRRLAAVERRADRLNWRVGTDVEPERLAGLLRLVGRQHRADPVRLGRLLAGSTRVVSAWDGESLVGIARAVDDAASNGYVAMVYVHPRWQGRGVGGGLMARLLEGTDEIQLTLRPMPGTEAFYASHGFAHDPGLMTRPRRA